jgi:hypothetical protein
VNARSRKASFTAALPFELKAAPTPVTGISLPGVFPGIVGPPQPALRLQQLMYHVGITGGSVIFTK